MKPGQIILAADGSLSLKVKSTGADHVVTEARDLKPVDQSHRKNEELQVLNDIAIGEKKNMSFDRTLPDSDIMQSCNPACQFCMGSHAVAPSC